MCYFDQIIVFEGFKYFYIWAGDMLCFYYICVCLMKSMLYLKNYVDLIHSFI